MHTTLSASDLRKWAQQCDDEARNPRTSGDERDHLLRMKSELLDLAENKDWLEKRTDPQRWTTQGIRNISFHL